MSLPDDFPLIAAPIHAPEEVYEIVSWALGVVDEHELTGELAVAVFTKAVDLRSGQALAAKPQRSAIPGVMLGVPGGPH